MSSLKAGRLFSHISIHYGNQTAVVVSAKDDYVALLLQEPLKFASTKQADQFSQWVRHFEADILRKHKRFMTA
jgi:hypothetical protein